MLMSPPSALDLKAAKIAALVNVASGRCTPCDGRGPARDWRAMG